MGVLALTATTFVQMLSGQLHTTAWPPRAWSTRPTWRCPSTTWTTSSTRTRMIWRRLVETLAHTVMNISLHTAWSGCVCVCVGILVPEECLLPAYHQLTALRTHTAVTLRCHDTDLQALWHFELLPTRSGGKILFFLSTAWFQATCEWNWWEIRRQGTEAIHFGPRILH